MAIIKSKTLKNGYKIQLVSGKHIQESYLNNKYVKSCMGTPVRSKYVNFYVACGTRLLRVLDTNGDLILRTLVWTGKDDNGNKIVTLDRVYRKNDRFDWDTNMWSSEAYEIFLSHWKDFADVRESARIINIALKKHPSVGYPYSDTFRYLNKAMTLLSNRATKDTKWILSSTRGARRRYTPLMW